MIEVAIEDNGEGINPKMIPNLFIKFSKSIDGNGLGLYISRKLSTRTEVKSRQTIKRRVGQYLVLVYQY